MRAFLAVVLTSIAGAQAGTFATVTIHADEAGPAVSSNLFGVFYEEINHAGEGGLYAEMVRNRAFHSSQPDFWSWETQGDAVGSMSVDTAVPLNASVRNSLRLTLASGTGSAGACNTGFWGMSVEAGATYDLGFYAKGTTASGSVLARLEGANGRKVYAQAALTGVGAEWRHFSVPLVSGGTDTNARLFLGITQPGVVWLDMVSLFPQATFHQRANGLRLDLADKIADLHPSFLRFPGGSFIEGYHVANALRWKETIGEPAERPGHFNDSWGYWSTDGLGAEELFQFCEDARMEPVYAINAGLMLNYTDAADNTVPLDQLRPWVQDARDLIEYADGSANSAWGARRAAAGHPAPFNLKYLEIGNENGGFLYDERYSLFYDAIKSNYPSIHLIAPGNGEGGPPWSRPVEIADEHYFEGPATFNYFANRFDGYSRRGPKIMVGEYAVKFAFGTYGNLSAALGEAAFMTGLERNSDLVKMACYSPLLANVNDIQSRPALIYFNNARSFGTPSYYVQQMFSGNRGDRVMPTRVDLSTNSSDYSRHGAIGVGSWNTAVEYSDLEVKRDEATWFKDDFSAQSPVGWHLLRGKWSTEGGHLKQADAYTIDCRATIGDTNWANCSISLRARKNGGTEGFLILFNWLDDDNWTWLNVGGWGNRFTAVEQDCAGNKFTIGTPVPQSILVNTWYDVRIVLSGPRIRCYVNGNLVQDVSYPGRLFVSSTYARVPGQMVVKAVNPYDAPVTTTFDVTGSDAIGPRATLIQLTADSGLDENSFAAPTRVFPVTNVIGGVGKNFTLDLPANSLSILRVPLSLSTVPAPR